jgi:hypothetical protein
MTGTGDTSVRSYNFFLFRTTGTELLAGTYATNGEFKFIDDPSGINFTSHSIMISNDDSEDIFFSFDGVNDHGVVLSGEALQQDWRRAKTIWFRSDKDVEMRFWAW